jgi:hypothetical protein
MSEIVVVVTGATGPAGITEVNAHIADTVDAHDASAISVAGPFTGHLSGATTVEGALALADDIIAGAATVDVVSNVATSRILGRTTAGSGDSEELTASDVKTLLAIASTDVSGLGDAATKNVGTTAGTVMAGDTVIPAAYTDEMAQDAVAAALVTNGTHVGLTAAYAATYASTHSTDSGVVNMYAERVDDSGQWRVVGEVWTYGAWSKVT